MGYVVLEFFMVFEKLGMSLGKQRQEFGIDPVGIIAYYHLYIIPLPVKRGVLVHSEFLMQKCVGGLYAVLGYHLYLNPCFCFKALNASERGLGGIYNRVDVHNRIAAVYDSVIQQCELCFMALVK